ncbi:MAG: hypothetical protein ACI959_000244 [Limisphaerales bacterium]|jgi:hypothetical protein
MRILILSLFLASTLSSCQKDYCLQCVDPSFAQQPIEGCDNDLANLEGAFQEWEAIGYQCVIWQP